MSFVIIPVIKNDIPKVVEIHLSAFQDFFLTQLGSSFLYIYYKSLANHKDGILLGVYENGNLIGFSAATQHSKSFNSSLILNNFFSFSIVGIGLLFKNPKSIVRLLANLRKLNSKEDDGEYAELLSIATLPEKQGQGIGKKLIIQLEKEFENLGCSRLSLTTDYYNNEQTILFYTRLGYSIYYEFVAYPNRKMYRFIKKIQL